MFKNIFKKWYIKIIVILTIALIVDIGIYFFYPDISSLKTKNPNETAFMVYRQQEWAKQEKEEKIIHKWVSLDQISPNVINAVIIAEDDKFWLHEGFDFESIKKAIEKDIEKRSFEIGASTISQQLAKNLYLSPSRNPIRKVKEAILTWRMERILSKKRILELYMNFAEWGKGIFGIEAAAQYYYKKPASLLTAQESAHLAAILPNPILYNPTSKTSYVENRSKLIYNIMAKRGVVVPDEYQESLREADE